MGNIKKKKHRKPFKNHFEKFYEFDTSYKSIFRNRNDTKTKNIIMIIS